MFWFPSVLSIYLKKWIFQVVECNPIDKKITDEIWAQLSICNRSDCPNILGRIVGRFIKTLFPETTESILWEVHSEATRKKGPVVAVLNGRNVAFWRSLSFFLFTLHRIQTASTCFSFSHDCCSYDVHLLVLACDSFAVQKPSSSLCAEKLVIVYYE